MHDHSSHDHDHDHDHAHAQAGEAHGHGAAGHAHTGGLFGHAGHSHAPASYGRAFAIGTVLNGAFVAVEVIFGVFGHSTALLADAAHNLADVLGLLAAWGASHLATRPPTARFTWGMRSSETLAALGNAVLLLVGAGAIGWEAIQQLFYPDAVKGGIVMAVAAAGILVNGVTALLFAGGRAGDINVRGAFVHMALDALVSAAVLVAGLVVVLTGWSRVDPLVGLAVAGFIVWGTWGLFRDSLNLSMAAAPASVQPAEVETYLAGLPGVAALHDLHIWPLGAREVALSAHLVMPAGHPGDAFLLAICTDLKARNIGHVTIQVETDAATACPLAPAHVI